MDITPPLSIPYLGYVPRHAFFEGVHDRLWARAVVVGDGTGRVGWVVADSIGLSRRVLGEGRDLIAEVRERVWDWCGIAPDHVMISATHAHSTPETAGIRRLRDHPGAGAWLETLRDQLASAVALADRLREPAHLKRGVGRAEGVGWSRRIVGKDGKLYSWGTRPPDDRIVDWGANDPEVAVFSFERFDGRPAVVLAHFACHPVTMQVQPLVSADFPGAASAVVERAGIGCTDCVYVQGAGASINPVGDDSRDFADVERYGRMLAGEILRQLGAMAGPGYALEPVRVGAASGSVALPSRALPERAHVERAHSEAQRRVGEAFGDQERKDAARGLLLIEEQRERVLLGDEPLEAEVQVLRIGDTAMVGIPGEPFVELGLEIKQGIGAPNALCVGYTNDWLGYIAPPSAWELGGYEVEVGMWSQVGPEAHGLLLEEARSLVSGLW